MEMKIGDLYDGTSFEHGYHIIRTVNGYKLIEVNWDAEDKVFGTLPTFEEAKKIGDSWT